ncbi:MAG: DUF1080 domain-containing protein [Planctomycetes bacterium]|nr:DUF1080 domain-containing protein [Planctomycetota bacterium]
MRVIVWGLVIGGFAGIMQTVQAEEGFTYSLFDGKSLAGWTVENDCEATVDNGMILLKSGNGWLRSDHIYADFKLHLEWKTLKQNGYDAGIYLRTLPGGKPFPKQGYQVNLLQGKEGNISRLPGASSTGLVKPAGEWNVFDITVVGETVSTVINGKTAYKVGGLKIPAGHVGIQIEVPLGGQFTIRNVKVTELRHNSLFTGRDFSNWEGAGEPAQKCWSVSDGVLTGLNKKGPWLRSSKQYGDFNLRMEYRVEPGANSGVYIRVPQDGNHHRDDQSEPAAGFEVQILDDSAAKYRKLKPYQFCGSVYDIAGASEHVGKPPGNWNTLEINCEGQNVTTVHNGVVIVRVTPQEFPLIKLRRLQGFLGLQNHGGGVSFRRIRIGPPVKFSLPSKQTE